MNTLAELLAHLAEHPDGTAPAGLDDTRLAAFETEAVAAFTASRTTDAPDLAAGRAAMRIRAWRAAATEQANELASMDAAFAPVPVVETPAVEQVAAAAPAEPVVASAEPAVQTPVVSMTAANADATRTAAEATPTPRRSRSMVAAAGVTFEGLRPDDVLDAPTSHERLADAVSRIASYATPGQKVPFAPVLRDLSYDLPESDREIRLNDRMSARRAAAQMEANDADQRIVLVEQESPFAKRLSDAGFALPTKRTAAVFCGPTQNSFDVGVLPEGGTPIYDSFPKDPSSRGKFRFRPSVGLSTFGTIDLDEPGIPWDADTNTGSSNSVTGIACDSATVCFTPDCLDDEIQVNMMLWKYCWEYQNTAEIVDPEGVAAQMRLWDVARDRQREIIMQTYLQACAQLDLGYYKWVDTTTGYGGIPDFLRLIHAILSPAGWANREAADQGYTLYIPERIAPWMALDELSREMVPTTEAMNTAALLISNPTAVFSRFEPQIDRVVQYKDDPTTGGVFTIPEADNPPGAPTSVTIKPLAAATYSIDAGAGAGSGVTATTIPAETIQTFRIWLSPTQDQRIADTGVSEVGPDRVTKADCDIVRMNRWERWRPYRRAEGRKTYSVDVSLEFNGARAGGVTPY